MPITDPAVDELLKPSSGRRTRRNFADIEGPPERITPLYDWLLVRRIEDQGPIEAPGMTVTKGGLWVDRPDHGPRKGVVVARGQGDKIPWHCPWCMEPSHEPAVDELVECPKCGTQGCSDRLWMDVRVGDTIIYPRFESSHVMIDGEQYTFCREGDVLAVLE